VRVLSVGLDLAPALDAQGIAADAVVDGVWNACRRDGGEAPLPPDVAAALATVGQVLRIEWIGEAAAAPARIICPRSQACPRGRAGCAG
jgi:hypothetical protein